MGHIHLPDKSEDDDNNWEQWPQSTIDAFERLGFVKKKGGLFMRCASFLGM